MKQILTKTVAAAALLASCLSAGAQNSPVGTVWDCLINGVQGVGVAYIEFTDDGRLDGVSIIRPNIPVPVVISTNSTDSGRGDAVVTRGDTSTSRYPDNSSGTGQIVSTNVARFFGYVPIEGTWNYDLSGRIIGYFTQTVRVSGTNTDNATYITNAVGFKAIVVPGRRLTLATYNTPTSRTYYTGIPWRETVDLGGKWYGAQLTSAGKLIEFFDLAPTEFMGLYNFTGTTATSETSGWVLVSARGRLGIAVEGGSMLRATVGTYSSATRKALTSGMISPGQRVLFNAFHYPTF